MPRLSKKTIRKTPPKTREIAKLSNELASLQRKLYNKLETIGEMEVSQTAFDRAIRNGACFHPHHEALVNAAVAYVEGKPRTPSTASFAPRFMTMTPTRWNAWGRSWRSWKQRGSE